MHIIVLCMRKSVCGSVCVCVRFDTCCLSAAGMILSRKRLSLISLVIREKACRCIFIGFDASLLLFLSQLYLRCPVSSVHSTPGSAQRATAEPASSKKLQFSH